MPYIETVPEKRAEAPVQQLYATDREAFGFLPNFTRAFSHRPEVYAAWTSEEVRLPSWLSRPLPSQGTRLKS